MSKKAKKPQKRVTLVTKPVSIGGHFMAMDSAGNVRLCLQSDRPGITHRDIAVTKEGIAAIKAALPLIAELEKARQRTADIVVKINKIKKGKSSPYGPLSISERGVVCGCTTIPMDAIPQALKSLGVTK